LAVVGHAEIIVRAITTGVKKDIQNSFNGMSGVGRRAGQQLGNALTRGLVQSDPGNNAFRKIQVQLRGIYPDAEQAAEGFTSLMRVSYSLQGIIGALVGSLSSLVVSLGSLIGAAGGAISSLVAVIPVFVAFGVAAMGMKLALGGIGEALNETGGAADNAAKNNKRLEESERQLANTIRKANERVTKAKEKLTDAQEKLTKALERGQEELQQIGFDAEDAALAEKRAALELERARETLLRVQDLPPNSRARREAELAFAEADLSMRRAIDRNSDLRKEQERLAVEGVEGLDSVKDAREGVTDAEEDLQDAVEDGTRAIEDATRAHEELQDEINNTSRALGGMQSAFDKLTPSQKAFVIFLRTLKPLMAELKESVAKGFLPDLETAIRRVVTSAFPTVNAGLAKIGDALGEASLIFAEAFEDQDNLNLLSKFFTNNSTMIKKFGEFGKTAFGAILGYLNVLNPIGQRFLDWIIKSTQNFEALLKTPEGQGSMLNFFENAGDMAARFGIIFRNVFGGLGKLIEDSFKPGSGADKLLDWFEKATENFANMDGGKLNNLLSGAADNTIIILDAITGVFSIFSGLADNPGIKEFWANLELSSKAFSDLLNEATKVSGPFGALLSTLIQIAAVFADSGQAMAFFETLDFIAGGFLLVFEALKPIIDFVAPFIGVLSAVTLVIGGLGTTVLILVGFAIKAAGVFGALAGVFTGAGVAGTAAATGTGLFATAIRGLAVAFAANPIGLVITGIVLAVTALAVAFNGVKADRLQKSALGVSAAFRDGASATDAWSSAMQNNDKIMNATFNGQRFSSVTVGIEDIKKTMEDNAKAQAIMARTGYGTTSAIPAMNSVRQSFEAYGKSLSNVATQDMPQAQAQFRKFRDESNLSKDQLAELVNGSEAYRDELIKQAEQYDITVHGLDGLIDNHKLMDFALGEGEFARRKATEDFKKYNESIGKAAIANSGFKDSLKDAMSEGEFDTTKFLDNMKKRAADAVDYVKLRAELATKGYSEEALKMVDEAGVNSAKVARELLGQTSAYVTETNNALKRSAFIDSGEYAAAWKGVGPKLDAAFALFGKETGDEFTAALEGATTKAEFDRIAKEWTDKLSIKPVATLGFVNNTGLSADRLERLFTTIAVKDGGLIGNLQKYAYGGFVSGPGGPRTDSILARLSNGEFVVNAASTNKYLPLLQAINSGSLSASRSGTGQGFSAPTTSTIPDPVAPTVNIVVNPSEGMNERELASKISRVLALQLRKGSVT